MFTRKLKIDHQGIEVGSTPMLLPSFSSRINLDNQTARISFLNELISGPFLISAYDIYHMENYPKITGPDLLFIDSGGYECNIDSKISDFGLYKPDPLEWNEENHLESISNWKSDMPTVIISYDHPSKKLDLESQIENANRLFYQMKDSLKEFLIKPQFTSQYIDINNIVEKTDELENFDIIGFTEKELGASVLERMENIVLLRKKMDENGLNIPIHIFGSLDPIITPLYYMTGADIFDGLSWLRFSYDKTTGYPVYMDSIGPKKSGLNADIDSIWSSTVYDNYLYLKKLEIALKKFDDSHDFGLFGNNKDFLEKSYANILEPIGGS